ncbi:protein kinase subdomain-containing protein [Pochonia chlamydosporia 170]|uniref:Protein kinase subdomain-containing protein n=1 Tax=Pochonia chlamydosporia 170 TaxID=1380566 RepID=A0A179GA48_METCM|nr:protein kinase subdomain-containing protein [Pochonia chlamydosporia 170]OAQ74370.2 protein kinase subdomain-containing protein [Pochonia chlamydosporia 170]
MGNESTGRAGDDALASWEVTSFTFSCRNTDSQIVIMCNWIRFVLQLSRSNFEASPQLLQRYLFFLQVAENFELDGYTVDDFYDWAAEPLFPIFHGMKPSSCSFKRSVQDFLTPETHHYKICGIYEKLVAKPMALGRNSGSRYGTPLSEEYYGQWPTYLPSEVWIDDGNQGRVPTHVPRGVLLPDGTKAFLKMMHLGDNWSLRQELAKYQAIRNASVDASLRISLQPETPDTLKDRWIGQIRDTLCQLHSAGISWGDAKPANVLVDRNMDTWIVDFGGGHTEGWVPKELADTIEGDLVGLRNIKQFIKHPESMSFQ